jgi:hypothetical protein
MTRRAQCKVVVRLIGLLVAGLTLSKAWGTLSFSLASGLTGRTLEWLWPFASYDAQALDELGKLVQFGMALVMCFSRGGVRGW